MNYNEVGIQAIQQEEHERAIEAFMKAIETNPDDPVGYINIGNVFAAVGDVERAEQFFQQAIVLDDEAATAVYGLANLYFNAERFEEAAKLYERSIQLGIEGADAPFMLAKTFEREGADKLALPYMQRAAELAPNDVEIQLAYGILLAKFELFDEAKDVLAHVLTLDEENADAHYNYGLIFAVSTEEVERAMHHLERAFTIAPEHTQARYIYDMIQIGLNEEGGPTVH